MSLFLSGVYVSICSSLEEMRFPWLNVIRMIFAYGDGVKIFWKFLNIPTSNEHSIQHDILVRRTSHGSIHNVSYIRYGITFLSVFIRWAFIPILMLFSCLSYNLSCNPALRLVKDCIFLKQVLLCMTNDWFSLVNVFTTKRKFIVSNDHGRWTAHRFLSLVYTISDSAFLLFLMILSLPPLPLFQRMYILSWLYLCARVLSRRIINLVTHYFLILLCRWGVEMDPYTE